MKTKIVIFIAILLLIFTSSSSLDVAAPWEGAAAVAPAGELPETGFFVATNSFPRNTVVEIYNIETERSIKAIVANTLNSPGLLAIVSRQTAEVIGMRAGSVSRVRMLQPTDPIAYLRFAETFSSGNPPVDSNRLLSEDALMAEVYGSDPYRAPAQTNVIPANPPVTAQPPAQNSPVITGPSYTLEPEWGNPRMNVVDVPDRTEQVFVPPNETVNPSNPDVLITTVPPTVWVYEQERPDVWITERNREEVLKDVSPFIAETPPSEPVKEVEPLNNLFYDVSERERGDINKDVSPFIQESPPSEIVKVIDPFIEPTEEPVQIVEPPPPVVVEEIVEAPVEEAPVEQIVEAPPPPPVEQAPPPPMVIAEAPPAPPPPPEHIIDYNYIIPGIDIAVATPERTAQPPAQVPAPTAPVQPVPPAVNQNFISQLARGQYYVQLASVPLESVENTVRRIDPHYSPVVLNDGTNLYKIMIGPLNQGESEAIRQRFRSIGYDALVRRGS